MSKPIVIELRGLDEGDLSAEFDLEDAIPSQRTALNTIRRAMYSLSPAAREVCECGHFAASHDYLRGFCRSPGPRGKSYGMCDCPRFTPAGGEPQDQDDTPKAAA